MSENTKIDREKAVIEEKLLEAEHMRILLDENPHTTILFSSKFQIIDCNPAAAALMGFKSKEELISGFMERITKSIPPYQADGRPSIPLTERFAAVLKEGVVKFETDIKLGGASLRLDVEFKKIPYGDDFAIVAYVYDMSKLYQREMELKQARELIDQHLAKLESAQRTVSAMFESNPHINILFDSGFKVIDCNPAAVNYLGFKTKEEMLSGFAARMAAAIPKELTTGRQTRSMGEWFMQAVKDELVRFETEFILGGQVRNVNIELKRIPYGESFALVGYILDITEAHEREMELRRRDQQLSDAVKEAEAANKAKSAFLSTMSHEIRTPMNAILGITEIQLQNETLGNDIKEALNKIYSSGDMLLGIINDILDLSKIEAGKLELITEKYDIASLISDTAQLNMMRIGSKPIEFELNVDENLPSHLSGDGLRVKQILNNILSNAFKYTSSGTVKLSVSVLPDSDKGSSVTIVFRVSDTGQGMTKEQVNALFEEYSRFNLEANRTTEGTGLGMSITRNLIQLMNGEIFIESEPGKGSVFTVHLPQGKAGTGVLGKELSDNLHLFRTSSRAQMRRVQIAREPMPYGSVLVVDDVETNIYVAKGLLAPYGLKFDSAESGFEAIEKIKNGNVYDVVFMDHMMPRIDGVEATRIIRSMKYDRPIVALTANAVAGQADIFLGNGFDDFISKPIDIRQLNAVLNKFVRDRQPPEVIEAARRQGEPAKEAPAGNASRPALDKRFTEVFLRDASRSLAALEAIKKNPGEYDEEELRTYVIHVHGIKSALAIIGEMELSAAALKLEISARDGDFNVMASETPAFLASLKDLVKKLKPKKDEESMPGEDMDPSRIREGLLAVKAACEKYDEAAADSLINGLREKVNSGKAKELLDVIAEHLLHSDFDLITEEIDRYMK